MAATFVGMVGGEVCTRRARTQRPPQPNADRTFVTQSVVMNPLCCVFLGVLGLLAIPVAAQVYTIPPGVYRTAAAYHLHKPQPAGTDAFYPDKRGNVVVVVPNGARTTKQRVAPDSVWGYVSGKGRTVRFHRGQEYRLEFADTLCVYSSTTFLADDGRMSGTSSGPTSYGGQTINSSTPRYFFSRGLTGLVFPLTTHFLREAYAASNPAFATAVGALRIDQSLADFDRKTGLFRVTTLYRKAADVH